MDWYEILAAIAILIAVVIMGGYIQRFRKEGRELKDAIKFLFTIFIAALKDYELTDKEKVDILAALEKARKEYKDVTDLVAEVANALMLARKRM